jgi:hypothetical protein
MFPVDLSQCVTHVVQEVQQSVVAKLFAKGLDMAQVAAILNLACTSPALEPKKKSKHKK